MKFDDCSVFLGRRVLFDSFLLAILGGCLAAINAFWLPYRRGFFCGDETLMYPIHDNTVSSNVLHIYGIVIPTVAILLCEWILLRESKDDEAKFFGLSVPRWCRAFYCVYSAFLFGVMTTEIIVNVAKVTVGRLRPHFFEACVPSVNCSAAQYAGRYIRPEEYVCTGPLANDLSKEMRVSFPSGHSSWAAFSMIYVALYLERRMRWRGSRLLRHVFQLGALLLSWFTALSRISDYKHHWSDVLTGYALGTVMAVLVIWRCTEWVMPRKEDMSHHEMTPTPGCQATYVTTET